MRLPPLPALRWSPEGCPEDTFSGDVFFSRAGGLAETESVFLAGCGLPQRWRNRAQFAIGELGFGTGLNALGVWRRWRETRSPGGILHFLSIESHPWSAAQAGQAHAAFPEIADLSRALLARWPVQAAGPQRRWFPEDGFCLTVLHGEVEAMLAGLSGRFDAWFLDGFAPSRNPQMWSPEVCAHLARLSAPDARLATYTVAGMVRTNLEAAGFAWAKRPGFGGKRERLEAWPVRAPKAAPWPIYPQKACPDGPVLILGGGAAGASVAHALARRGRETLLLEAGPALGAGASGNPAALIMPRLDRGATPAARFYLAAYLAALDAYQNLEAFQACGVRQPVDAAILADFAADPPLPADLLEVRGSGLWHPRAGVLRPAAVLADWTSQAQVRCGAAVARLSRTALGWAAFDADHRCLGEGAAVVIASGPALANLEQTQWLTLHRSRGQIEFGSVARPPSCAVADGAYAAPFGDALVFGATFDPAAEGAMVAPDLDSRRRNLAALQALAPELAEGVEAASLQSRAAVRAATADRLPVLGQAPDAEAWRARYAALAKGAPLDQTQPPPAWAGLYLIGGLGARGYLSAPLLAEHLAAELGGEPLPMDETLRQALHPARFLARALKRGREAGT